MDPFERETLGTTDVVVTRFGLGTAPLGGWPTAVPREQGEATIRQAWDRGVRYFDTAPFYGHGKSETFIGTVLGDADRDGFTLSTKVGRVLEDGAPEESLYEDALPYTPVFDFSREGVGRSLAESRARFGFDRIDVALVHDAHDHHEDVMTDAFPELADRRASGEIGAIGAGMVFTEPCVRFAYELDFDCFLLAGRYTLLEQGTLDELFPVMQERGMSMIAGGVYNSGLLIKPEPGAHYDYAKAPDDVVKRAQELDATCQEFDVPLRAAALQFAAAHPVVASVVVGARTTVEVDDNLEMATLEIPPELWTSLKEKELLRADAPTP